MRSLLTSVVHFVHFDLNVLNVTESAYVLACGGCRRVSSASRPIQFVHLCGPTKMIKTIQSWNSPRRLFRKKPRFIGYWWICAHIIFVGERMDGQMWFETPTVFFFFWTNLILYTSVNLFWFLSWMIFSASSKILTQIIFVAPVWDLKRANWSLKRLGGSLLCFSQPYSFYVFVWTLARPKS